MNRCWVLIVTRGLNVWLPPEVYVHDRDTATREAARWRTTFRIPEKPRQYSPRARALHLVQTVFPDPWRACPLWVGITWSVHSYPRLKMNLIPAGEQEAAEWLHRRIPKRLRSGRLGQVEFERRGVVMSAGILRVKRVSGF